MSDNLEEGHKDFIEDHCRPAIKALKANVQELECHLRDSSRDAFSANAMLRDLGYKRCDSIECNCGSFHKG